MNQAVAVAVLKIALVVALLVALQLTQQVVAGVVGVLRVAKVMERQGGVVIVAVEMVAVRVTHAAVGQVAVAVAV